MLPVPACAGPNVVTRAGPGPQFAGAAGAGPQFASATSSPNTPSSASGTNNLNSVCPKPCKHRMHARHLTADRLCPACYPDSAYTGLQVCLCMMCTS